MMSVLYLKVARIDFWIIGVFYEDIVVFVEVHVILFGHIDKILPGVV